jgi:hypothetical protein
MRSIGRSYILAILTVFAGREFLGVLESGWAGL